VPGEQEAAYASIIPATIDGVKQYIQFLQKGLVGVDAETGKFLWQYGRTAEGSPANIPTPVEKDGYVYSAAGRSGGGLAKVAIKNGEATAEQIYFAPNLPTAIGGTVLLDKHLYGTSRESMMCVEFLTGKILWQERSIGAAGICYADGCFYLHGEQGEVALVEATSKEYREKGRFTPPNPPDHGRSKTWAYPVIADGKLYIHDWGTLWCYDVKK
jgi:outer membrane protein assembly factor BamB